MATHDYSIANQSFPATRSDINNALAAIQSSNSAATAPSGTGSTVAGELFYNTTSNKLQIATDANGTFVDVALDSSGDLNISGSLSLSGTTVTSTAAELNILDGVTATASELNALDGITATVSELNILDGVTATSSELNLLDGVTATTTELNYVDGVTSAIQTQIDSKQATLTNISDSASANGYGTRTVSTSAPSGGSNGDVWYRYDS